jgi:hypothetical protein
MIPPLDPATGLLPPGIPAASWDELATRFGQSAHRQALVAGLRRALDLLRAAGCSRVYIDGSFVTAKAAPGDFDACWQIEGVDFGYLARHAPTLLHPFSMRERTRALFAGDLFPASLTADREGRAFLEFFQQDSLTNQRKGIVALDLESLP